VEEMTENVKKSSAAAILFAWLLVGVPLGWGVYNTLLIGRTLCAEPARAVQIRHFFSAND
jgi:hypothetical protein